MGPLLPAPIAPHRFSFVPSLLLLLPALGLALLGPSSVLTPGGYRPERLVQTVEPFESLLQTSDGVLRKLDTRTSALVEPGSDPRLLDEQALDTGWITFAHWTNDTGTPLHEFVTEWRVPPAPSTRRNQTLFLFNGLQNTGENYGILQPVLQWGPSAAGGGRYWTIASWYVTSRGQAFHTPLVRVEPGDTLVGVMRLVGGAGRRLHYSSEFRGLPKTRLLVQNIAELTWSSESLEAYGVRRCSEYPAAREVPFRAISLLTDQHPPIQWRPENRVTTCGQHTHVVSNSSTDGRVDLRLSR